MNIPIFIAADNNYAPYAAVTIASICANTDSFCEIYILESKIKDVNKEKILRLKEKFKNCSIEFWAIDANQQFDGFATQGHVTLSTYSRFLIPQLKPNINKAIYLDSDLIVMDDIKKLYDIDLAGFALGAVREQGPKETIFTSKQQLCLGRESIYFNAGVLLIDSERWRENNIVSQLIETEKKYHDLLKAADQDVLNFCFENKYKLLDDWFNVQSESASVVIRHFVSIFKPWQADFYLDPYTRKPMLIQNVTEFWKYAKMTPFHEEIQKTKEKFLSLSLLNRRFNEMALKQKKV